MLIEKNVSVCMVGKSIQKALMYSDTCCDTHVFALVQNFERAFSTRDPYKYRI